MTTRRDKPSALAKFHANALAQLDTTLATKGHDAEFRGLVSKLYIARQNGLSTAGIRHELEERWKRRRERRAN